MGRSVEFINSNQGWQNLAKGQLLWFRTKLTPCEKINLVDKAEVRVFDAQSGESSFETRFWGYTGIRPNVERLCRVKRRVAASEILPISA